LSIPSIVSWDRLESAGGPGFLVAVIDDPALGDTKLVVAFDALDAIAVLSLDRLLETESVAAADHPQPSPGYAEILLPLMGGGAE
jgi:hypothetical protein